MPKEIWSPCRILSMWGKEPKWTTTKHFLLSLVTHLPQFTYPLGYKAYYESVDKYGEDTITAPHNLWREVCHFIGGVVLGIITGFFVHPVVLLSIMFSVLFFAERSDVRDGAPIMKSVLDSLFWIAGAILGGWICLTFFLK